MPVISRLPGGVGGSGSGGTSDLSLNIFTQPDEPEVKNGLWIQRANSHKKIVVDNLISSSGEWSDFLNASINVDTNLPTVFNEKITLFDTSKNLWTFDGGTWAQIGGNSVEGADGSLFVLGSTLYLISEYAPTDSSGSNWGPVMYKWTGSTWTKVCNIPATSSDSIYANGIAVLNGYVYVFKQVVDSNGRVTTQLMRSNGSSFSTVTTSNYCIYPQGPGFVINSKIHWLVNYFNLDGTVDVNRCIITSTGGSITFPGSNNTPFSNKSTWTADIFDSLIHVIVMMDTGNYDHYTFDGSTWTKLFDLTNLTSYKSLRALNTRLYALGGSTYLYYSKTHDKYPEHTLILQIADTHDGPYEAAFVNVSSVITNGRLLTKFNDAFFVGESGLETTDPIYYGDGSKWIKFKN